MLISEIFKSIQGEGKFAGAVSVFVRTSGCNLRCMWCDTPYTSWMPIGEEMSVGAVVTAVCELDCPRVVITGGEPMIAASIVELTEKLHKVGLHITIETAGTVWRDVVYDLASISPKTGNSIPVTRDDGKYAEDHDARRIDVEVVRKFIAGPDYQLKFVMDRKEDLEEIESLLAEIDSTIPRENVLLMPQGVTAEELASRSRWIAELCMERGYRFCPRLHIELFGNTPGT